MFSEKIKYLLVCIAYTSLGVYSAGVADGKCAICQDVFGGRTVTIIPCCRNNIHKHCMQRLFQNTPLEERETCPLCRSNLPELAELLGPEPIEEAQQHLPDAYYEPPDTCSPQVASGHAFVSLPPQVLQQRSIAAAMRMREANRELSDELVLALANNAWDYVEYLHQRIQNTQPIMLTDEAQQALNNKMIEVLNKDLLDDANRLRGIFKAPGQGRRLESGRQ